MRSVCATSAENAQLDSLILYYDIHVCLATALYGAGITVFAVIEVVLMCPISYYNCPGSPSSPRQYGAAAAGRGAAAARAMGRGGGPGLRPALGSAARADGPWLARQCCQLVQHLKFRTRHCYSARRRSATPHDGVRVFEILKFFWFFSCSALTSALRCSFLHGCPALRFDVTSIADTPSISSSA